MYTTNKKSKYKDYDHIPKLKENIHTYTDGLYPVKG